jgi:hypothetical protein
MWSDGLRDGDAARRETLQFAANVAKNKAWTPDQFAMANADIEKAYQLADEEGSGPFGYGVSVRTFWLELGKLVTDGRYRDLPNGEKYANAIVTALKAVDSESYTRYMNSWKSFFPEYVAPTVAEAAQKAAEAGNVALDLGKQASNPWWIWGVAAIVLGVAAIKLVPARR